MRILLSLFLCLLFHCQSILGGEQPFCTPVAENSSGVFDNYDDAIVHANASGIPVLMVLLSGSPSPILDEILDNGFGIEGYLDPSLKDMAVLAVIRPTDQDKDCVQSFLKKVPEVTIGQEEGIFLITLLLEEDGVIVLNVSSL
ncbi:hypothetical protein BOKEGFJH_00581 [Chlamydia avium]|uniref:Uncharacterized protein n=1 Tax=Chlamydia avium TaxID=1457141 RepID=A0ABP2X7J9_9CHLA|nr:hypothetical protein [Chlamydia avium]EPP36991.1 hypothetical protein CP10743SC13_0934 [Chlamydia psittaci 10_743_SC13]EPP38658.1 hypothetical protein CP10881SC42_0029 [Chlamydia avium]VVT43051.1 hypothetical protein BOKEGFJH_00581 [Chlamydia avium]